MIGARKPAAPKHQPGSLTRNGVVTNGHKPATPTWTRTQPVRSTTPPRDGVIGRRASQSTDTKDKPQAINKRTARQSRRNARIAKLTGKTVAAPEQHELMDGVMDRAVPGVIGRRPPVS